MDNLQPGDPWQIGPYVLRARLSRDGVRAVYLGQSPSRHLVAVKLIPSPLGKSPEFRARFAHEIATARKLHSKLVARVMDAGVTGPYPWIASEYVSGISLTAMVERHGPIPIEPLAILAARLTQGLNSIHEAGAIHSDLSPDNVIVTRDGPRIIGFGIWSTRAPTLDAAPASTVYLSEFTSLEQADRRAVEPLSDIFNLGTVLAFAARGKGRFGSEITVMPPYGTACGNPSVDGVTDQFRKLLVWCMSRRPQDRPTARLLLTELAKVNPPVADKAPWLPARFFSTPPERGMITAKVDAPAEKSEPQPAKPAEKRKRKGRHRTEQNRSQRSRFKTLIEMVSIILVVMAVGAAFAAGLIASVAGPRPGPALSVGMLSINQYEPGDCLTGRQLPSLMKTGGLWPSTVKSVPCDETHFLEVIFVDDNYWLDSEIYPGNERLSEEASTECGDELSAYLGHPYSESEYQNTYIVPYGSSDWRSGDRMLVCFAYLPAKNGSGITPMKASITS